MKYIFIILGLVGLLLVAGCSTSGGTSTPTDSVAATPTAPTVATDAYPAHPTPTPQEGEYPAPAAPAATVEPTAYPSDMEVWVLRPLGQQCAEPESYEYEDLGAAVDALEQADVEVLSSEEVIRPVCQACDCSTSEHFRVQIRAQDLAVVQSMGWIQE